MPGRLPQAAAASAARLRVDLVATGEGGRLGAHRGRVDPGRLSCLRLRRPPRPRLADHHGARAVGGRAGLVETDRVPQHLGCLHRLEGDVGLLAGARSGFFAPLRRSFTATIAPMCVGRVRAADVGAHVRGEVAARARADRHGERHRNRQRPHGIRLGLLLPGDGEHALVHAGLHRGSPRRCAVEPPTEPAVCTRSSGLPAAPSASARYSSGIIDALEHVGRLADDDGVDIVPGQAGVIECAIDRLAAQPGHGHVASFGRRGEFGRCRAPPRVRSSCPPIRERRPGSAAAQGRWSHEREPGWQCRR